MFALRDNMKSSRYALTLVAALENLLDSKEFRYLHAYVNTTKHQSLISWKPSVSFVQGKQGLKILSFSYGASRSKELWPEK